jgi:hypothetical protein
VSKFDDFTSAVLQGSAGLARDFVEDRVVAAKDDVAAFLTASQQDLQRWTQQLAAGQLTQKQFKSLVRGQADVAQLFALAQAGATAASLQRFRNGLIDLVVKSAFAAFL